MSLGMAAALSCLVALLGWRLGALTGAGGVVSLAVGTPILAFTGWAGFAVLGTFFVSSVLVGRLTGEAGPPGAGGSGETRDHWQVLANGGAAAALAPLELGQAGLGLWLVTVSLAAAAADTWATGVGALSPRPPRDILRGTVVAPGTSGGVTWLGSSGGLVGAALVGLSGGVTAGSAPAALYLAACGLGFAGMLADSVLGASLQGRFHCPACGQPTERRVHGCGTPAEHRKGWRWLTNDGVNAIATWFAAALGGLAWWLWASR
jgi:uncharacterized protein (TIGR00297 family)